MKLNDFKLNRIRKEFVVEINGELEKVTVYNILNEEREEIRQELEAIIGETNTLEPEDMETVYNILFRACTDIEVDEDTIDVINNPNKDMILILNEIKEILDEIYIEVLLAQTRKLNEVQEGLILKMNLLKTEKLELLGNECTKLEKELEDMKKEFEEEK